MDEARFDGQVDANYGVTLGNPKRFLEDFNQCLATQPFRWKHRRDAIDSSPTERPIVRWLKQRENAWILPLAVKMFPVAKYALPEFCFGTDYRADFVVMGPFSGGFDIQFIEMEPPIEQLFTRAGKPADRFAGALAQVRD